MRKIVLKSGRILGDGGPVFVIAEVGINHDGDVAKARELIDAAKESGADSVKLQTYDTDKRVSKESPVYDVLKKCELSYDDQNELINYGMSLGLEMFSTPFDDGAVDFLQSIGVGLIKVASFDSVNKALLRKIAETKCPVIMSTGMTSQQELLEALKIFDQNPESAWEKVALLHCVSAYPLDDTDANLSVIRTLRNSFKGPVGYSDHTIGIEIPVLAVAGGAQIVEKHFTLDCASPGPDHAMSADPITLGSMISKIRSVEEVMGNDSLLLRNAELLTESFRRHTD